MIYKVLLRKEKTYWWDEDSFGSCIFNAKNDEQARAFVATIVQRMNRKYWRIGEQRNVFIQSISRIKESGLGNVLEPVSLWNCIEPLKGFRNIRLALEAFYPKNNGKRIWSMMHMFSNYEPIRLKS